jgi:hypothetical protein
MNVNSLSAQAPDAGRVRTADLPRDRSLTCRRAAALRRIRRRETTRKVREETYAYARGVDGINTPTVTHRWCAFVNEGFGPGHPGSFHKPLAGVAHGHAGPHAERRRTLRETPNARVRHQPMRPHWSAPTPSGPGRPHPGPGSPRPAVPGGSGRSSESLRRRPRWPRNPRERPWTACMASSACWHRGGSARWWSRTISPDGVSWSCSNRATIFTRTP